MCFLSAMSLSCSRPAANRPLTSPLGGPPAHWQVLDRLSDGSGNFDAERLLQRLPSELELDAKKAGKVVEELAGSRKRDTLVQVRGEGGRTHAPLEGERKKEREEGWKSAS